MVTVSKFLERFLFDKKTWTGKANYHCGKHILLLLNYLQHPCYSLLGASTCARECRLIYTITTAYIRKRCFHTAHTMNEWHLATHLLLIKERTPEFFAHWITVFWLWVARAGSNLSCGIPAATTLKPAQHHSWIFNVETCCLANAGVLATIWWAFREAEMKIYCTKSEVPTESLAVRPKHFQSLSRKFCMHNLSL